MKTFVMLKPDATGQNIIGEVLKRIEAAGLTVCAAKLINMTQQQAEQLYEEHKDKDFYQSLLDLAMSGPVLVTVISGEDAVKKVRDLIGATDPKKAAPGTVRADFGSELPKNIVHASDSEQSANREIPIFFSDSEILR